MINKAFKHYLNAMLMYKIYHKSPTNSAKVVLCVQQLCLCKMYVKSNKFNLPKQIQRMLSGQFFFPQNFIG